MYTTIRLPRADGTCHDYTLKGPGIFPYRSEAPHKRVAYAAAHMVCNPLLTSSHAQPACIDWDATLAYRRHLWSYGLGVAEAMDTAQRGMGLDWPTAQELIRRSLKEAQSIPGALIACGAGTDHLYPLPQYDIRGCRSGL